LGQERAEVHPVTDQVREEIAAADVVSETSAEKAGASPAHQNLAY
jgi:hypothetical protein